MRRFEERFARDDRQVTLRSLTTFLFFRFAIWGTGVTFGALPQAPLREFFPQTPIFASRRVEERFALNDRQVTLRSLTAFFFFRFAIWGTGVTLGLPP